MLSLIGAGLVFQELKLQSNAAQQPRDIHSGRALLSPRIHKAAVHADQVLHSKLVEHLGQKNWPSHGGESHRAPEAGLGRTSPEVHSSTSRFGKQQDRSDLLRDLGHRPDRQIHDRSLGARARDERSQQGDDISISDRFAIGREGTLYTDFTESVRRKRADARWL